MISRDTFLAIYYTSFCLNILCFLTGILLYKYQSKKDKIIILYLILSVIFDFLGSKMMDWFGFDTNYHMLNTWSFVEFIIIWVFYFNIKELKTIRFIHILSLLAFLILCTVVLLYFKSYFEIINTHKLYSALYYSSISIFLFYQFLNRLDTHLLVKSLFWQNSAFFIYFTGNILTFLMIDYVFFSGGSSLLDGWAIHNTLTIIKAVGLTMAFYINKKHHAENLS